MTDGFYETARLMTNLVQSECDQVIKEVSLHFPTLSECDFAQIKALVGGIYYFNPAESSRNKDIRFISFALAEALSVGLIDRNVPLKQLFDEDKAFMKTFIKKYNKQWN